MVDLSDITLMGRIGVFLLLFIVCIAAFSMMIDEFVEMEESIGGTSHDAEYQNLKFILGFVIVLSMAGCLMYLSKKKKKKEKEDQDGN